MHVDTDTIYYQWMHYTLAELVCGRKKERVRERNKTFCHGGRIKEREREKDKTKKAQKYDLLGARRKACMWFSQKALGAKLCPSCFLCLSVYVSVCILHFIVCAVSIIVFFPMVFDLLSYTYMHAGHPLHLMDGYLGIKDDNVGYFRHWRPNFNWAECGNGVLKRRVFHFTLNYIQEYIHDDDRCTSVGLLCNA
jgi:hypothetical protein